MPILVSLIWRGFSLLLLNESISSLPAHRPPPPESFPGLDLLSPLYRSQVFVYSFFRTLILYLLLYFCPNSEHHFKAIHLEKECVRILKKMLMVYWGRVAEKQFGLNACSLACTVCFTRLPPHPPPLLSSSCHSRTYVCCPSPHGPGVHELRGAVQLIT